MKNCSVGAKQQILTHPHNGGGGLSNTRKLTISRSPSNSSDSIFLEIFLILSLTLFPSFAIKK
jgi:hypothetical protein